MPAKCEICGRTIYGQPILIEVDGAMLRVCGYCAKLGLPIKQKSKKKSIGKEVKKLELKEPELILRKDYNKVIKQAREQMGLSQEQLGMKISEKPSVIKLLESGKLKPDDVLIKKLTHFLKVKLLVPIEEEINS